MFLAIENNKGAKATFSSLGARLVSLLIPGRDGELIDVVQGFDTEEEYQTKGKSHGAICGRVANRIANASFVLAGHTYLLPANDGAHCLHSGNHELRLAEFTAEQFGKQVHFVYQSPDLERGFPGNVTIEITYTLTDENALKINLQAKTDKTTPINLTAHPYFNLNGAGKSKILNHKLKINADKLLEIDKECIPTGKMVEVFSTAFDFTELSSIGEQMDKGHDLIDLVGGYDHCYVLNQKQETKLNENAELIGDTSGIKMIVYSTYPGLQFFTANQLSVMGKAGKHYGSHSAVCLEPQFFPDSPNQPQFPSVFLEPKQKYDHTIIYQFEVTE